MEWDTFSDAGLFTPDPKQELFNATASIDHVAKKHETMDAYELAAQAQLQAVPPVHWFDRLIGRDYTLEDTLGNLVLILLEHKAESWEFSTTQASFAEMHIKVNFPNAKDVRFNIRTMDHKTTYSDIVASKAMRRQLYRAVIRARDRKVLAAVTTEVKKQVFMIEDRRETK